ncbi:MAG: RNB domain-containing ribonuclease [Treponema sp.]|nr:RNB domain-containing ribonuclease [Treponema sp.]
MFSKNSVVIYKNTVAVVSECGSDGEKFTVSWCVSRATASGKKAQYASQKVREKDVLLLCEENAASLDALLDAQEKASADGFAAYLPKLSETRELLLSDEETASSALSFSDLAELTLGSLESQESWAFYCAIKKGFDFKEVVPLSFVPCTDEEIAQTKAKQYEKEHAEEIRAAFLERLKQKKLSLPDDAKYMGEVEALALGKTDKCRTLRDIGIKELPEKAHKLLLDTGVWSITRNPYPLRWGLSMQSAAESLASPPADEERITVPGVSYAIDSEWSTDPDDAISFDGEYLWVHIADPASTVLPESSIDKAARARGSTLYIPEGASRMLSEESLADYALGLQTPSRALSFKIKLGENGEVEDCDVLCTLVTVERLSYTKADELKDTPALAPLFAIAERNIRRRKQAGAVQIQLPEVHITVDAETKDVSITPYVHTASSEVVREAMLLAGEGAARFAFKHQLPFPFISQEVPDIPSSIPEGLAGQFRLRKCMRKRTVSLTPSQHAGLGLGMYSQVTSPLRRYGDLISHEQLRAFLSGRPLIDKDDMLLRMSQGDAAAVASRNAERKSNAHWTLVYLLQHPDWTGEAVCVEKMAKQSVFLIPSIGMETVLGGCGDVELNGTITVKAEKINLPELEVVFSRC